MLLFILVPVLAYIAGILTHWRFTRKQRVELTHYHKSAMADYMYAPGQRR